MNPGALENFLLLPSKHDQSATIFELERSGAFRKNSFVLIPYCNPQTTAIQPLFFTVENKNTVALPQTPYIPEVIRLKAGTTRDEYIRRVNSLKHHIQAGDIYEINYCMRFTAENAVIDPLQLFSKLQSLARAPYAALVKLGNEFIISASPELFLEKKAGTVLTKPIKGTIRRGNTPEEDALLKNELHTSIKERTENVMAVDVARNDLSRFAKKASVKVNKLYNIETFETVHQMVSTVSCEVKENTTFDTMIQATFPMASMTGAPKIRAMQLIGEFENFERGYYSGAMGLIDEQEDFGLSVIIRSIFYNQATGALSIAVGGAITYLCDAEKEYEECLLKANALLKALNAKII